MKKKLLAGLATGLLLVGMGGVASASTTILEGTVAVVSSATEAANRAGLDYELLDNGDGTVTFNLTPELFDGSPYLQALTVGIVKEDGTFSVDYTYGSSDGTTPVNELTSGIGGVYSYTTAVGELTGPLGMFLMVNGRAPDNGNDLQTWIGITPMTTANNFGTFNWNWNNRIQFDAPGPVPEPATMLLFGTGLAGLAAVSRRRNKKTC